MYITIGLIVLIIGLVVAIFWNSRSAIHRAGPLTDPTDDNEDFVEMFLDWCFKWNNRKPEDLDRLKGVRNMRDLFEAWKKTPLCRSAKMIAKVYFDIYVYRDPKAMRNFLKLMEEYYGDDDFQWGNAIDWKAGTYMYDKTFNKLFSKKEKVDTIEEKTNIDEEKIIKDK